MSSTGRGTAGRRAAALLRRLVAVRLGLAGQVLTFAAMVLPILLREVQQVYVLVFASAIATLLGNAAPLAYPFLYPVIRGPRLAQVATVWSTLSLAAVSALVLLLTPLESPLELPGGTFAATAALTGTFGLYSIALTRAVRFGDEHGIGLARLVYGGLLLPATLAVSVVDVGPLGLTLATCLAYLVSAAVVGRRPQARGPRVCPASKAGRRRLRRAYLGKATRPTLASLANGWVACLPGLALPGLGQAAGAWAVVSRICGGFSTVLAAVVAPPLEARLSRAVRDRDRDSFAGARRAALLVSSAVAALGLVAALALTAYAAPPEEATLFWLVALATALFWGPLLVAATITRLPDFLGRHTARLAWETARATLLTAAFLAVDGPVRLVLMGVVLTVFGLGLVPMTRWPLPRVGPRPAAEPAPGG